MNASFLLPSELMHMATLSGDWTKQSEARRMHTSAWPTQYDSPSTSDAMAQCQRRMCLEQPSRSTPGLSYTPASCSSSDSTAPTQPFHPVPELSLSSYLPDMDILGGNPTFDMFQDSRDPLSLSESAFQWMNSFDEDPFTIHSPKPIFAYKTLQFDLDRIQSPQIDGLQENAIQSRKRSRDDEDEDASQFKKRRMSQDPPKTLPFFPEPSYPTTLRRNSFADETCIAGDQPTWDALFEDMYGFDSVVWQSLSSN